MQNEDLLGFQSLKERQAPNRSEYLFALTSTILPRSADYEVKLTPDHESLRNTIRDFAEKQIRPIAAEIDRKNQDRKSTRLNSSHVRISYAVFCLKKKNKTIRYLRVYISTLLELVSLDV